MQRQIKGFLPVEIFYVIDQNLICLEKGSLVWFAAVSQMNRDKETLKCYFCQ